MERKSARTFVLSKDTQRMGEACIIDKQKSQHALKRAGSVRQRAVASLQARGATALQQAIGGVSPPNASMPSGPATQKG